MGVGGGMQIYKEQRMGGGGGEPWGDKGFHGGSGWVGSLMDPDWGEVTRESPLGDSLEDPLGSSWGDP